MVGIGHGDRVANVGDFVDYRFVSSSQREPPQFSDAKDRVCPRHSIGRPPDVEKRPSEKGPPRKVYSLNAQGEKYLEEFWRTWSFLSEQLEQLREREA